MTPLIEGTRFTSLLHAELNRLRRNRPLQQFYDVADALDVPRSVVSAWMARPVWHTLVREAESLRNVPRCPNPNCGGPLGHAHDCGDTLK